MKNNNKKILLFIITFIIGIFFISLFKSYNIITAQKQQKNLDISTNIDVANGEYIKTTVKKSTPEYCTYVHTFTRRLPIPLGTEHYFLIISEDQSQCISIRANKEWANKFQNGLSIDAEGVPIEGYVKKLNEEAQLHVNRVKNEYEDKNLNINVNTDLCIDLLAVSYAKKLVIASILALVIVAWFIFDYKKNGLFYAEKNTVGKTITTIATCILFIAFIFIVISRKMLWGL